MNAGRDEHPRSGNPIGRHSADSGAMRARARSPATPLAATFMPSIPACPGMCWARLREPFPAAASPTVNNIRHHVGSQHKGRLGDVVDVEARLRGHQYYFGLPLGAHHGQMSLSGVFLGG
ncbi:hypothetical protein EYF80_001077 [Liparis tanakae]|uniref:Uncharacterized protein n=1 Tax=Liparis tanakae TaxID=230148 RepID=A0A4Z2JEQ0_9TELE|nr:hypothetical protein EYF80_001077 [Liparis tanakae]